MTKMQQQHLSFQLVDLKRYQIEPEIWVLTLKNPPENRLNSVICKEIIIALNYIQDQIGLDHSGALITTADSPRFFSNGADLEEAKVNRWANTDGLYPMLAAFLDFPFPTVVSLTGHTFGAGCLLALAHDYRIMNSKRGFLCMPPVDLGIYFKAIGAPQRLKLRPEVARQMMLESRRWTGEAALKDGLVDALAPANTIFDDSLKIARKWASKAKMGVYGALRNELYGEAADVLRINSHIRSRETVERPGEKL